MRKSGPLFIIVDRMFQSYTVFTLLPLILLLIILFPEIALWLPRTLMPMTFR